MVSKWPRSRASATSVSQALADGFNFLLQWKVYFPSSCVKELRDLHVRARTSFKIRCDAQALPRPPSGAKHLPATAGKHMWQPAPASSRSIPLPFPLGASHVSRTQPVVPYVAFLSLLVLLTVFHVFFPFFPLTKTLFLHVTADRVRFHLWHIFITCCTNKSKYGVVSC